MVQQAQVIVMQNSATSQQAGGSNHNWQASANMYNNHQRSTSNPRAYTAADGNAERREEYPSDAYPYYNNSNNNYNYGAQPMSLQGYSTTTTNRRASGNKPASTPPASAAATSSPASRFYPTQGTPDPNTPYQPTSAPPAQPQTAHPYGGGYHNYYDYQQQGQSQGQWPAHYAQNAYPASRSANTPQTAVPDAGRPSYDYYQNYNHDRTMSAPQAQQAQQQPPQPSAQPAQSSLPSQQQSQQPHLPPAHQQPQQPHQQSQTQPWQTQAGRYPAQQWQGYNNTMPNQYASWQQPWNPQYYPPATPHTATHPNPIANPAHAAPPITKKDSKDYDGLGKRPVEHSDDEVKDGKKKKGKKEEPVEKPVPKPPAKSHLHPPRQAQSMWQLFFTDELNKAKEAASSGNSPGGTPHHAKLNVAQIAKDAGIAYANLTAEQKAYYVGKVQESKDQYAKELAAWQATLTPEDIRVENAFRAQQRKEGKSRKGNLKDPNAPKKPLSAYFLFLKGIREDDALRARVWGDESETTKQSVLAAERWRSLSDEEKRPFLSQAEKDKQDYEAARKTYEEDAAARARGEDVPTRIYPEPAGEVPKLVIKEESAVAAPLLTTTQIGFDSFVSDPPQPELLDEYQPFPLGGMDLGGFQSVGRTNGESGDWGQIQNLVGGETDVAPSLDQAADQTQADTELDQGLPESNAEVRNIASGAGDEVNIQPAVLSSGEHPASEATVVEPHSDLSLAKPDVSPQVVAESVQFGSVLDNVASEDVPDAPAQTLEEASIPDVPQETTLEPAKAASEESTSGTSSAESDVPAADGV